MVRPFLVQDRRGVQSASAGAGAPDTPDRARHDGGHPAERRRRRRRGHVSIPSFDLILHTYNIQMHTSYNIQHTDAYFFILLPPFILPLY